MHQFKNYAIAVLVVVIAVQALAFTGAGTSLAKTAQDVFVTNTAKSPVPIAGSVGLDPAKNTVRVASSAATPVWVRDANNALQPFHQNATVTLDPSQLGGAVTFTVPAGKRLVIEFASMEVVLAQGRVALAGLTTVVNGVNGSHWLNFTSAGPAGGFPISYIASQEVRIYADPGTQVLFNFLDDIGGDGVMHASISGYLVDVP